MSRIAGGIGKVGAMVWGCALGVAVMVGGARASAQASAQSTAGGGQTSGSAAVVAKPIAPASVTGCVQKAPDSSTTLVISTPTVCALLTGKVSVDKLAGHEVVLTGVLTPRTTAAPASIKVDSVGSVGKSCSDVCSLKPPGTRGLHPPDGAVPGSEGGTPGAVQTPQ